MKIVKKALWISIVSFLVVSAGCVKPVPLSSNVVVIDTSDGWNLAVTRFQPEQKSKFLPVILCHGMGCNGRFFDAGEDNSLARHLAEGGYDVWVVNLRGSGGSTKPGFSLM